MKIKGIALLVVAVVVLLGMVMKFSVGAWMVVDMCVIIVCAIVGAELLRSR